MIRSSSQTLIKIILISIFNINPCCLLVFPTNLTKLPLGIINRRLWKSRLFIQARIDRYAKALNSHRSFRPRSFVLVASCRFWQRVGRPRSDSSEGRVINAANIPRISLVGFDTCVRLYISRREIILRGRMLIASNDRFLDFDRSGCVLKLSSSINSENNIWKLSDLILLG